MVDISFVRNRHDESDISVEGPRYLSLVKVDVLTNETTTIDYKETSLRGRNREFHVVFTLKQYLVLFVLTYCSSVTNNLTAHLRCCFALFFNFTSSSSCKPSKCRIARQNRKCDHYFAFSWCGKLCRLRSFYFLQ